MTSDKHSFPALPAPCPATAAGGAATAARSAALTLAFSLPQGLLALPIAVAHVGLAPGLLILVAIGALNTATAAWTARAIAGHFARHGVVPSLSQIARHRLGPWGGLLAVGGGAALFFLALLASMVGLARSLADLSGAPAPVWGAACALVMLLILLRRVALSSHILCGLGLLNVGLVVALILIALPHARLAPASLAASGSPLTMVGVSLMLFFAPMLLGTVAQQVLPLGYAPRSFVIGSAAGVAGGAALFGVWAAVVCSVAGASSLAGRTGTAIPVLIAAVPEARFLGALLGSSLLGMTALRCALVLAALADERLPKVLAGRGRRLVTLLPAGLGLALAIALLCAGATSFTWLIALAGIGAASVTSLVIPALLARSDRRRGTSRSVVALLGSHEHGDWPHARDAL